MVFSLDIVFLVVIFPLDLEFLSYDLAGNLSKFTPDYFFFAILKSFF